jgi:hypothetical protein
MADKKRKPTSMDEVEKKALPEEAGLDDIKGIEEEASSDPAVMEQDVTEEDAQTPEAQNAEDDDPFADIRRSLVEEEAAKREKKNSGILHRVTGLLKGGRRKTAPLQEEESKAEEQVESALVVHDSAMPVSAEENTPVVEAGETSKQEAEEELLAVLFPPVESVDEQVEERVEELRSELIEHPEMLETEPEPEHHIEEIKSSEVLRAHPEQKEAVTDFESMRGVALEGYDEAAVETEAKPAVSGRRKLRMVFKTLKPIDRFMIFGALFLIFAAAVAALGLRTYNSLQPADITPEPTQDLPIPVRVTLPGGWEFKLSRGRVVNGRWSPSGAEWLEGTEVCRWVALPWSLQLEAVVRTLKLEDPIDLTMSNADQLKYKVQSIQNVPVDEIDSLVGKNMCLLLILVNEDSDTRWVVTATP